VTNLQRHDSKYLGSGMARWFLLAVAVGPLVANDADRWVNDLGSQSYHRRESAAQQLENAGLEATQALEDGLHHPTLEVRRACQRILRGMAGVQREAEIEQLVHRYEPGRTYSLPGWAHFRSMAGDGLVDRALFVDVVRRHPTALHWLESLDAADSGTTEELATIPETLGLHTQSLAEGHEEDWALLLMVAHHPKTRNTPTLVSQVYGGLLDYRVKYHLERSPKFVALLRLIDSWIASQADGSPRKSLLQVCLRYNRLEQAVALSERLLENGANPSTTQFSLLALARIGLNPTLQNRLKEFVDDHRLCHTWQIVGTTRRAVRSEVRDTALVLLLHAAGHDPRKFGFDDLQSDPDTVFRDYSIGFSNVEDREKCYAKALSELGLLSSK
jgi:hypothetical protein